MFPRPRFRLPLWAAIAIIAAAYVIRSIMRGMDFRLDWPLDAIALGMFVAVLVMVGYIRKVIAREDSDESEPGSSEDPPAC